MLVLVIPWYNLLNDCVGEEGFWTGVQLEIVYFTCGVRYHEDKATISQSGYPAIDYSMNILLSYLILVF